MTAVGSFAILFTDLEEYGGVGLFKEKEAGEGVGGADDGEDPEDPAPGEVLDDQAAEKRAKGGSEERAQEIPAEYGTGCVSR